MCGATKVGLKPADHMEMVSRLENVLLRSIVYLQPASYLSTALVTGPNYLLLPTHVFWRG